jgi:hypothetical protein
MAIADKRTEKKIFNLISIIKWSSENKSKNEIKISGDSAIVQPTSCCSVQGSGLKAGVVGRKMKFSLSISNVFGMFDLFLQLKGPRNEVYSEKIVSLHQSSETILNNKNKITKRINPDQKIQNGEAKVLAYLEDGHGNTYVRWKNVKQYGAHAVYNVFNFNCTCSKEGCFAMSFTPVSAGIHTLSIRWQDKHVDGSPFKVKVYKLSDVSRRGIAETKDKRVLFDSLSMSFDGQHHSLGIADHTSLKEKHKHKGDAKHDVQSGNTSFPPMRKQYTITKRRILKKVISRNGEEIIITESPTPPLSRQSSFTDNSDCTSDDGSTGMKTRSRSSSPILLRAVKNLSDIRRQRSRSSSSGSEQRKSKLQEPAMEKITEKTGLNNASIVNSPTVSSSLLTTGAATENDVSTASNKREFPNCKSIGNPIGQKFLDLCLQALSRQKDGLVRQNSDSAIPQYGIDHKTSLGRKLSVMLVLSRSLSDSSLENKIPKDLLLNSQGCITQRSQTDLHSHGSSENTNLKLLQSESLRKSCFYISEKAINKAQSLVFTDSPDDSSSGARQTSLSDNKSTENTQISDEKCVKFGNKGNMDNNIINTVNTDKDMLPKINTEIERPHNDVSLNNDRSHDRSHDKKNMATSLFSRNKMGTKTNEPIDYDGIKPTEQINAVKIPCVNEGYEKCNVEKWLENQFTMPRNQSSVLRSTSPHDKALPRSRTMSNEIAKTEIHKLRQTMSTDSRRSSLQKQASVFPDADSDPSLDDIHIGTESKHIDNNMIPDSTGAPVTDFKSKLDENSNSMKVADVANDSVESQPSHKAVFRTISNLDCKNIGQFATRVAIVVPKVKCDKGTTVSASEIIRETACHPALVNYNILRRRVCMTVCPKTFIDNVEHDRTSGEILSCGRNRRSLSVDECTLGFPRHSSLSKKNISDRYTCDRMEQVWIKNNPHGGGLPARRQSTVETIDSGMEDDNGIKIGRRASLYCHFRHNDNQHQTLCRRPYKGQIPLDPKLVQSANNSEISNGDERESSARSNVINGEKLNATTDNYCLMSNIEVKTNHENEDSNDDPHLRDRKVTNIETRENENETFEVHPNTQTELTTTSNRDPMQRLSTPLSNLKSTTTSSLSVDEMYCGFGVNQDSRADLLDHLSNFQNLDTVVTNTCANSEPTYDDTLRINPSLGQSEISVIESSSFSPNSDFSSLQPHTSSDDVIDSQISSTDDEHRYVTSVEYPFYLQVNDVIIKRSSSSDSLVDSKQTIDSWEECESLSYFPDSITEDDDSCCRADGTGLIQGYVGMKNNFQVIT